MCVSVCLLMVILAQQAASGSWAISTASVLKALEINFAETTAFYHEKMAVLQMSLYLAQLID